MDFYFCGKFRLFAWDYEDKYFISILIGEITIRELKLDNSEDSKENEILNSIENRKIFLVWKKKIKRRILKFFLDFFFNENFFACVQKTFFPSFLDNEIYRQTTYKN